MDDARRFYQATKQELATCVSSSSKWNVFIDRVEGVTTVL